VFNILIESLNIGILKVIKNKIKINEEVTFILNNVLYLLFIYF